MLSSATISGQRQRPLLSGAFLLWCLALLLYKSELLTRWIGLGLLWNLLLAAIPLFWSAAFSVAIRGNRSFLAAIYFVLWLLFLPNAPYLLTDLMHLNTCPFVPLWYVLALLLSCAGTGALLGFFSLLTVHEAVEEKWGTIWGWCLASGALMLCGFGIYLGRFLRWNSWDALTRPQELALTVIGQFRDPGTHPHPFGVTLVFGTGLILAYFTFYSLTNPRAIADGG